ncbi:MAG: hypothetical protein ACOVP5_03305, partial [Chitinophagales bacterium]
MIKLQIREIINQSVDFFKSHYEFLLPFSLIYFVLSIFRFFIPGPGQTIYSLLILPLAFGCQYFIDRVYKGHEKKFSLFFDIYRLSLKYISISFLKVLIYLIIFLPFLTTIYSELEFYHFNQEEIMKAIQTNSFNFSHQSRLYLAVSMVIALMSAPFLLFVEYYGLLDGYGVMESFQKSYHTGAKYYLSIFKVIIVSEGVNIIGFMGCCILTIVTFPLVCLIYY